MFSSRAISGDVARKILLFSIDLFFTLYVEDWVFLHVKPRLEGFSVVFCYSGYVFHVDFSVAVDVVDGVVEGFS